MTINTNLIKAAQMRGARGLLNWSQEDLAKASGLSVATIRKLELEHVSPRGLTNQLIRQAFEEAGLEFIDPSGVRQRPEDITVYQGEDGVKKYLDDIYQTSLKKSLEIVQVYPSTRDVTKMLGIHREMHVTRMIAAQDRIKVKCILTEEPEFLSYPYIEYRFLSRHFVDSVPFYVYGDKYAILSSGADQEYKIIVIQSRTAAESFRRQFHSMWERATPLGKTDTKKAVIGKKRASKN